MLFRIQAKFGKRGLNPFLIKAENKAIAEKDARYVILSVVGAVERVVERGSRVCLHDHSESIAELWDTLTLEVTEAG